MNYGRPGCEMYISRRSFMHAVPLPDRTFVTVVGPDIRGKANGQRSMTTEPTTATADVDETSDDDGDEGGDTQGRKRHDRGFR